MKNGQKIKGIYWLDNEGEPTIIVESDETKQLELSVTHHGEFDMFWALLIEEGKEIARYNVKTIDSIVWDNDA